MSKVLLLLHFNRSVRTGQFRKSCSTLGMGTKLGTFVGTDQFHVSVPKCILVTVWEWKSRQFSMLDTNAAKHVKLRNYKILLLNKFIFITTSTHTKSTKNVYHSVPKLIARYWALVPYLLKCEKYPYLDDTLQIMTQTCFCGVGVEVALLHKALTDQACRLMKPLLRDAANQTLDFQHLGVPKAQNKSQ